MAVVLLGGGVIAPAFATAPHLTTTAIADTQIPQALDPVEAGVAPTTAIGDDYGFTARARLSTRSQSVLTPYAHTADTFVNDPESLIQWPFTRGVPIGSGFGYRAAPCRGCSSAHQGLDMNPGTGTPIQVIADGVVSEAGGPAGNYGQYVIVDHLVDGRLVRSLYAHMLAGSSPLSAGDYVSVGDEVGLVGNTGRSTGAHLHLEIRVDGATAVDPRAWLGERVGR